MASHGKTGDDTSGFIGYCAVGIVDFLDDFLGDVGFELASFINGTVEVEAEGFAFGHDDDDVVLVGEIVHQHFVWCALEPISEMAVSAVKKVHYGVIGLAFGVRIWKNDCGFVGFVHCSAVNVEGIDFGGKSG